MSSIPPTNTPPDPALVSFVLRNGNSNNPVICTSGNYKYSYTGSVLTVFVYESDLRNRGLSFIRDSGANGDVVSIYSASVNATGTAMDTIGSSMPEIDITNALQTVLLTQRNSSTNTGTYVTVKFDVSSLDNITGLGGIQKIVKIQLYHIANAIANGIITGDVRFTPPYTRD